MRFLTVFISNVFIRVMTGISNSYLLNLSISRIVCCFGVMVAINITVKLKRLSNSVCFNLEFVSHYILIYVWK